MLQICYASRATRPLNRECYEQLVAEARQLNTRDAVTGLLLYDGARFLQALEGPAALTDACMGRISRDRRHRDVSVIGRYPIQSRQFGGFAMAGLMPEEEDAAHFLAQVKALVEQVDQPRLKAMFIGFAMLSRANARPCGPAEPPGTDASGQSETAAPDAQAPANQADA